MALNRELVVEGSAYNGHFESVCYHPLLLFNGHGEAKLRAEDLS